MTIRAPRPVVGKRNPGSQRDLPTRDRWRRIRLELQDAHETAHRSREKADEAVERVGIVSDAAVQPGGGVSDAEIAEARAQAREADERAERAKRRVPAALRPWNPPRELPRRILDNVPAPGIHRLFDAGGVSRPTPLQTDAGR